MSEMSKVREVTGDVAKQLIDSGAPVIVDFWATWCGPCKAIAPKLNSAAEEVSTVQFLKVTIEETSGRKLAAEYAVQGIPTLVKFNEKTEVARMVGAGSLIDIIALARK